MIIKLINKQIKKIEADIEIVLVIDKKIKENKELLKSLNFKGNDEEVVILPESKKIYVGCENDDHDSLRIALSCAVKKLNSTKFKSAKVALYTEEIEISLKAMVEGILLGSYKFDKYKSEQTKEEEKSLFIATTYKKFNLLQKIVEDATLVSDAVNLSRDIINTTPDDFYPAIMAMQASGIARENKLECKIYDESYLKDKGMGAMLAVGKASNNKPKLIHLTYKPKKAKKKIVIVGKGLTYDCGGLSLKPSDFMVTMKSDKSGGAAVMGIMSAVAQLKLPFEIHGIIGAVENMIGPNAYKPDDVITAKNGTTIEVRNTDAEGRLVLADCLCYAQDEIDDIDYIFDLATLTGACVVGLGEYTSGVMGNNDMLKYQIVQSAIESGEYATSLPFNRYLKKLIKSEIADICNIASSRYGGAITAALFLDNFIKDKYKQIWAHIDIAGPAYVEKEWGYNPHGASGAGVRLMLSFMQKLDNE